MSELKIMFSEASSADASRLAADLAETIKTNVSEAQAEVAGVGYADLSVA